MNIIKKLQIKMFNKNFIEVFGKDIFNLIGKTVVGKAKRNDNSYELNIEINSGIILKVDRGKISLLNEEIRYSNEFDITFIITKNGLLEVININGKQIHTSFNKVTFVVDCTKKN